MKEVQYTMYFVNNHSCQKTKLKLVRVVAQVYNPNTERARQEDHGKFEASLGDTMSSRPI